VDPRAGQRKAMAQTTTRFLFVLCARMWQVKNIVYMIDGVTVWTCLTFVCLTSANRVSMLLHVLRWSYGKVLLLPSCSAAPPCPSSSLETRPRSDGSNRRRNTRTRLHPRRDRPRDRHPRPHPQPNWQGCPGNRVVLIGEFAQRTRWTLSSQSVR